MHYRIEYVPAGPYSSASLKLAEELSDAAPRLLFFPHAELRREWLILGGKGLDTSILASGFCKEGQEQWVIENFLGGTWNS